MPLHSSHHSSGGQPHSSARNSSSSVASGIFPAGQTLGAIGAPVAGNVRVATSDHPPGVPARSPASGGSMAGVGGGGQTAPPSTSGLPGPGSPNTAAIQDAAQSRHYDPARKQAAHVRPSEELHIPSAGSGLGQLPSQSQQPYGSRQNYHSRDFAAAPDIALHQASPHAPGYPNSPSATTLPGTLQPGNLSRPGPSSSNTAPSTIPTVSHVSSHQQSPQLQPQQSPYTTPLRSSTTNHSHAHSRSSPAGFEGQRYVPFSTTPETSKYASSPNPKYTPIQTMSGAASNSPLALADIRPRADSGMSDGPTSANPYSLDNAVSFPANSNYMAPWPIYAFDWCKWPVQQSGGAGKVAVGSYLEDGHNFIQILDTKVVPQTSQDPHSPPSSSQGLEFFKTAEATHSFPVTRLLWEPASSQKQSTDLLATSGDHLRLWSLPTTALSPTSNTITRSSNPREQPTQKLTPLALLSNSKSPEHTAPLTSLDWNTLSPSLIITSSIDTTCTIWDIPSLTAKTQLIAHDREVFDVRFCANSVDVFVSCGADGSVRMFDLRSLEHSTIIYEPNDKSDKSSSSRAPSPTTAQQTMSYAPPLLRLAASPHDAHLLATFSQDSNIIRILDVRQPGQALLELRGHSAALNCIEWSPSRRGLLASGGDDCLVLTWDLLNQNGAPVSSATGANGAVPGQPGAASGDIGRGPTAAWGCDYEIGNISWTPQSSLTGHGGEWLGVSGGRGIWGVKM
ncbi:MAG: hypothetical protein M4579_000145 [Chaenotheca gracillima]|nr:MAG: hypothetical protein M4579_000145 [Chaenotheca gracillima]